MSVILFVDFFGESVYGDYTLLFVLSTVISLFLSAPANQLLFRFLPEFETNYLITSLVYNYLIFSFFGASSCFVIVWLNKGEVLHGLLTGYALIVMGIYQIHIAYLQSKLLVLQYLCLEITRSLVYFLLPFLIYFFFNIANVYNILMSLNVSFSINLIIICISNQLKVRSMLKLNFVDIIYYIYRKNYILNYIWPLIFWFLFAQLLNFTDRFIISKFFTQKEVGYYSAIYDVFYKGISLLLTPISLIYYPILVRLYKENDYVSIDKVIQKGIMYQTAIFLSVCVILRIATNDKIITYLPVFMRENDFYYLAISIISGAFFWQISILVQKKLELLIMTKIMLMCCIISFFFNIFLNIILLKTGVLFYAGINTSITSLIYFILIYYNSWKYWRKLS